ncbi:MAG: fused MFS/spermidine synthase [Lachnospiraceae bacterium]|nr:fused MFS/spermidine synthase [Lachnospiraceae bacterium]
MQNEKEVSKNRKILNNKIYLYLTEFFAGMSVMAVELGASRLLAPYFSSSQIVWTIIIGTIMIAMALGNIYGGRSADKNPDPDRLYRRIILAAIWIALIPVLGKYIILGISAVMIFSVNSNFLIWAAFAACMIIFVFPLFLLGTVTPSLVKYAVSDLDDNGKTVGFLNASNTIGSIIGTFVPTFVTIPSVGVSATFYIFAGILLALSIIYFCSRKQRSIRAAVGVAVLVLACIFCSTDSFAFWEDNLTYEGESVYNYLQVKEDDEAVYLSTNVLFGVQSVYVKDDSLTGYYYDYAMASTMMADVNEAENLDVLILGMGTGTFATQCDHYFDNLTMEGVEIDEDITELATEYFHLSEDIPIYTYDGRAYLNAIDKTYDVIMVDAYQDITIPFQMSTVEFFTLVKEHLNEGGVMVINMNMRGQEEGNINQYIADTVSAVFSEVYTVDCSGNTNRELFASDNPEMIDIMKTNIELEEDEALTDMMTTVYDNLETYEAGDYLMTDDKAPVELLGMQVIDDLIADEVTYYKNIYAESGLSGLLEEFQ